MEYIAIFRKHTRNIFFSKKVPKEYTRKRNMRIYSWNMKYPMLTSSQTNETININRTRSIGVITKHLSGPAVHGMISSGKTGGGSCLKRTKHEIDSNSGRDIVHCAYSTSICCCTLNYGCYTSREARCSANCHWVRPLMLAAGRARNAS